MNILFLCNKSPWPPREGGPMAMNMFISGLIEAGHHVRVLAVNSYKYHIRKEDIPEDYRNKTCIELVDVDLRIRPVPAFLNLFTGKSYHVERFISTAFRDRLRNLLQNHSFDVVQLEIVMMAPYIETIRQYSDAVILLRAHNIEHLIWERTASETLNPLRKWYLDHLARTLRHYETSVIGKVDGIIAITEHDANWFRGAGQQTNITSIPFGIDPALYQRPDIPEEFPSLFSIGSMNWIPNQEGIRWFLRNVWPEVHLQFPQLRYYLAGREMPLWMRKVDLPNVVVLGEVDDAIAFIASKSVMIVPLFSGSGIRIKIIEGMAAGRTVISTTVGAEGIGSKHREQILLADNACTFFDMISLCIENPVLCRRIGQQAREWVSTRFDRKELIDRLTGFYYFCRSKKTS